MHCLRYAPIWGVNNATAIACGFSTRAAAHGGCAVYPDDDNAAPLLSANGALDSLNLVKASSLPAKTIVADTVYRWCHCSDSGLINPGSVYNASNLLSSLLNGVTSTIVANAAQACGVNAVPPSKTGALTGNNAANIPILYVSQ